MSLLPFNDEKFNAEINYIIGNGYYLKDENLANDELLEHTEFTHQLFLRGLETKTQIKDEEVLEFVGFNQETNRYYAQWYNQHEDTYEYINFK